MLSSHGFGLTLVVFALATPGAAQEKLLPPSDRAPQLILIDSARHAGARGPVRAVAFAPDASALYVGGFDKQVRRYELTKDGYKPAGSYRVPIGPGNAGVVNALAVSPDGKWVAVAGRAPVREEAWAGADDGIYDEDIRQYPPLLRRDLGVVYLFDPAKPDKGRVLRGQQSEVRALAFTNPSPARGPVLVTAGIEWNEPKGEYRGTVRVFDVTTGDEIGSRDELPASAVPPGLAAWATGAEKGGLRVAVAWDAFDEKTGKPLPSRLLTWDDPKPNGGKVSWEPEALLISPLAVRIGKDGAATELLTGGYDPKRNSGGLNVRPALGGATTTLPLRGENNRILLPTALAAFPLAGADATAMLLPVGAGASGPRYELRLLTPKGQQSSALEGFHRQRPVLGASPDGRFVAVAGFKDNHVEVHNTADLAAGKSRAEKLAGAARGFGKVAFLVGEKLLIGDAKDGCVLDLGRTVRTAAPRDANAELKLDAPAGAGAAEILEAGAGERFPRRVSVTVGAEKRVVTLPFGEHVTAAAVLPAKPAWAPGLGSLVAVSHVHERSQTVLVTLFDPATAKPLFKLGGPTLPVTALAFSGTRPLLAGAGDDGTIVVWSLKGVWNPFPALEGLVVTAREGALFVASVQPDTAAAKAKLKADDVIESVADAKGVQQPVKTLTDFLLAIRALKVGDTAQLRIKGRGAVAVEVGTGTGFRHPLFTLWVDPEAKDGKHDWVGWTSSGPYDANSEASEARIGWLTATGDPARPVTFAGANQYRKLFYKRDFLRLLLKTADYNEAVSQIPPPRRPTLTAVFTGATELRDGRAVARKKLDGVDVTLNDPDTVIDLDRAELQWQIVGPAGASEWARESFAAGRANLDLGKHTWTRGEHRVHVKVLKTGEPAPVAEVSTSVWFVPPAPTLKVTTDLPPAMGAEIATEKDEVEITATVDAKGNSDGATVALSWTGGKPVEMTLKPNGTFAPTKVKLKPEGTTVILVTATNRGAGPEAAAESSVVEVRVRKLPPKVVPPPAIKLLVLTEHDTRTVTDAPFVVSTPTATLSATVTDKNPITDFEWKIGDADWQPGKLDAETHSETREIALPAAGAPLTVQVRAKSKASAFATDSVVVRYDGLPEVSVTLPPPLVTTPELNLSGGLKVTSRRPFKVRVLVRSSRTGRTREFDPVPNEQLTAWSAGITLFPGENELGYVVSYDNDRKEVRRTGLVAVRYARPPVVAGAAPVDVGTGAAGDVALAVVSSPDAPPKELWVNGARVAFRAPAKPVPLFGVGVWPLRAEGVSVNPGADRLKPISVMVRNAESDARPIALEVRGREEVKIAPPTVRLTYKGNAVAHDQALAPVGDPNFTFELTVVSEARLSRVEIWHGNDPVKVDVAAGRRIPVTLRLRAGTANTVRVVAANEGGTTTVAFNVSYVPPPVRVVIDSIREPNGKPIELRPDSDAELVVEKSVIDVEGRVLWDFDDASVARDPNLTVTFIANGVAHLPVRAARAGDGNERKFSGRVYLNTPDPDPKAPGVARVRAVLRSGSRPVPIPQEGLKLAEFAVTSKAPLRRQRLHVLLVGVEVPRAERKELVRRVVRAVGGAVPANKPDFTHGEFARAGFEFAYLYNPRLDYTQAGDLNALLSAARADILQRTKHSADEWVNDVIVVYYQGEDWVDENGRWLLHSATTLSGAAGRNPAEYAIRLDDLPQIPGMPVAVVNVASSAKPGTSLSRDLPFLRYAWEDTGGVGELLPQMATAIRAERTVKEMAKRVSEGLDAAPEPKRPSRIAFLPDEVLARVIGLKKP